MKLRCYQEKLISDLYQKLSANPRCLLVSCTGSGKTVVTAHIIRHALSRGRKCWFIVHRNELVTQTVATLQAVGLKSIGVIKSGYKPTPEADIQVASIQTMGRRLLYPPEGALTILDECHVTSFSSHIKPWIQDSDGFVVGVTATPRRAKKSEGIAPLYGNYVTAPSPKELIEMGFLVPARFLGYKETFDLSGVRTQAGDFKKDDLAKACNIDESNATIVTETLKHIGHRTGIVFAVNVDHAKALASAFNEQGIITEVVTGATSHVDRAAIYEKLRRGEIKLVSSVGVLTEGFDIKSIELAVMARPTKSWSLWVQMTGRVLRICDGKDHALVLDFAGNHARHGMPTQLTREEMAPDYPDPVKGEAPTRECPKCNTVQAAQNKQCEDCEFEFPISPKEKLAVKGELVDLCAEKLANRNQKLSIMYGALMRESITKNYSPFYPTMKFKELYHRNPTKEEMWQAAFGGDESHKPAMTEWLRLQARKKGKDPKTWGQRFLRYEFGNIQSTV